MFFAVHCRYITDNGNYILDLTIPGGMEDPFKMDRDLKTVTGVVDHGIFINMATKVCAIEGLLNLGNHCGRVWYSSNDEVVALAQIVLVC